MAADKALLIWLFLCGFVLQLALCSRCPDMCDCLGGIVDCAKASLTEVPPDLPQWVEKLDLSKNKRLKLTENALNNLPKLQTLYLQDLGLESLPALGSLPSLRTLYLGGNRFKKTDALNLSGMPRLRELDLSRNRLVTVTPRAFANVTLFRLNLSKNKIDRLDSQSFKTLGSLAELRMSRNLLNATTFNRSAPFFTNLTNLVSLDLNGNKITVLPGLMFEHLKRLKMLKLRRNQIVSFSDGAFYGLDELSTLQLDHNNITTVRKGWVFGLGSLQHLSISYNQIDSIRPDAWEPTEKLQTLDLSHNRLVSLREGTFRNLRELEKLSLSSNYLAHIERNTFALTPNLKSLDLSSNQLRWSIEDDSGAFGTLSKLQELSLAYNGIETVHVETFAPLESLTSLDLRGNQLRMIPLNPFSRLKRLSTIHMNTSNLVCDCELSWFPGWISGVNFNSSTLRALCSYPPSLKDRPVAFLPSSEFSCESSPRPIISQFPKDFIALRGDNVTLACVAQASTEGDQPRFFWRKDNELLVNFDIETRVSVIGGDGKGGAIHNVTSLLKLPNVTDEDSGSYQCVVRNHFGASYSRRAKVQVHVFPYFTKKPASVAVPVGGVAKLDCAVAGSPAPNMSLLKDGGDDFPAARERRLHAYPNENTYFIKPVEPHDQGQYTCKATNEAGTATANASIIVRQTPKFTKPLQDRVARVGESIVLECQGTGQPTPRLSWIKNGVPLQEGDRYVLVQESQYLLILDIQVDDAGTYICELTNILGTIRGPVKLSVKKEVTTTSTTTGIVMMAVVCCVVITSLVWVVIIYQTRKRSQSATLGPPGGFPEDGVGRYPSHLPPHHHLPPDLVHTFTPLLANPPEAYTTTAQDSGSEHSSGKDSGTGDSAQRSSEDLLPIDLMRSGLRRSLIICADSNSASTLRGMSTVNVGPHGEILGCEDPIGRPRLSTFSSQHMAPGGYNSGLFTATLRCGSNSRLVPVPTPVTPAATLPRSRPLLNRDGSHRKSTMTSYENSGEYYPQKIQLPNESDDNAGHSERYDGHLEHCQDEFYGSNRRNSERHNARNSVCSAGDNQSELDVRTENAEVTPKNIIPAKNTLESR